MFALLAVLLAGARLYSVVACQTSERTQRIGARAPLGATRRAVVRHVVGCSLLRAAAGAALGLLGALALPRLLPPLLYETASTDPPTFTAATVFLLGGRRSPRAWLPARRAAHTDLIGNGN